MVDDDLQGTWQCQYWFQNTKHDNREEVSQYTVAIRRHDNGYAFRSVPNGGETSGSQLEGQLGVDGSVVTGTWTENTAPSGEWNGMTYTGALQLLRSADNQRLSGKWVATIYNNGNPTSATGRWEFTRKEG